MALIRARRAQGGELGRRLAHDPAPQGVVQVVVQVCDPVADSDDGRLQGAGRLAIVGREVRRALAVPADPCPHLVGQVQRRQHLKDAQALLIVPEPLWQSRGVDGLERLVQSLLAGVAKGRMADVVPECDRLGQVLVQPQCPRDSPGDLRDLQGVGQPRPVVVATGVDEDLRLVLEPPERLRVEDSVAVAHEARPPRIRLLGPVTTLAGTGKLGELGQRLPFALLDLLADGHHSSRRSAGRTGLALGRPIIMCGGAERCPSGRRSAIGNRV
jgi:hypothetical protein